MISKESLRQIRKKIIKMTTIPYVKSYSQTGEDLLVRSLLASMRINKPTYMDIGANDPVFISNTALFYKSGCRGVNIEPNPQLFRTIKRKRKKDVNLNVGIGPSGGTFEFYVMNSDTMSTFSKEAADKLVAEYGFSIIKTINIPIMSVKDIVDHYCNGVFPDFLTIDTEGMDYEILKSIDYSENYPKVICAETREYGEGLNDGKYEDDIEKLLIANGYQIFANTYLNTIFYKK